MSVKGIDTHEQYKINHRINDNRVIERRCSKCLEWKEETLNNFYLKNKSKPEMGFTPECRICTGIRTKESQKKNPNLKIMKQKAYQTYKKGHMYIYDQYWESHKEQYSNHQSRWRKDDENKDRLKGYGAKHRKHDINPKEWSGCLNVFDNQCAYCGLLKEEHIAKRNNKFFNMNFHKEHVDDKGYNDLRNAIPSCKSCNSSKHKHGMEDWYKKQQFFSEERYNKIIWWITEGYKDYIDEKLPYRIVKKKNIDNNNFHYELWSVDEKRNMLEIIATKNGEKDLKEDIEEYILKNL